jgi:nucleotidyltransferase/DNA polymerase involved in DNA repair
MRIIAHLDMDAFFASIEERDNPRFTGMPVVVGADPGEGAGRGVVSTANYAARKYGIRSALPISKAWQFSEAARRKGLPAAIFVSVNMKKYSEVSHRIMEIVSGYLPNIEQASVDEAYGDLSHAGSYEQALIIARDIKKDIFDHERLTASIGIGPNKLIAKIASDRQKPDGLTLVREEEAATFLEPLSIRTIPGVGPKSEQRFHALGVQTVQDAKRFPREELIEMMGKWGNALYDKLRGQDDTPLVTEWIAKSIGEQETFGQDTLDATVLENQLRSLAKDVFKRFIESGFSSFQSVTLTVRFADFTTRTRTTTLGAPDAREDSIFFQALRLFMPFLDARENPKRKLIRLVGVRIEKLI